MHTLANPDYSNTPASRLRPHYSYAPENFSASPIVSLITPFFNAGPVFHETAVSVFRQSLQQWEWIIVDDCSDNSDSASILDAYASRDPRIRVLRSSVRGGPAAARNSGVCMARAAYVAFIDSDDLLEPTALEKWLWFLYCHNQYGMVKGFQAGFGAAEYIWREGFHSGAAILQRNLIQTACMMRREIYQAVGGMDETIRGGMEDWEFWLRCANAGHWGWTIPEVLDWYRRRTSHNDRWENWDSSLRESAFRDELQRRYPRVFNDGFPRPESSYNLPYSEIPPPPVFENRLSRKPGVERLLLVLPHLVLGGSDQCIVDLISQLTAKHSYEITVVTTLPSDHHWRHRFEALTPDVFTLDTFLGLRDYPGFLAYVIHSRQIDSVLINHSQLGYQLLPYLRSECPQVRCFDYVHLEEPTWKAGGYPAYSISYRHFLDRTIASTQHLKAWMIARGGDAARISVVTTNIDVEDWTRSKFDAGALRKKWNVPEGMPVLLFAARLCEQKQPDVLADTLHELHNRKVRFLGLVAGDGEQASSLRQFVATNGLAEVCFLGSRSIEELRELFAISDVFFLPSRHEGIALTLYEAMAMEVVVVAADVGGQRELLTPECGVLVEPGEGQSTRYADALESLLQDHTRRKAMAVAARKRVSAQFRLEDMGCQMAGILSSRETCQSFDIGQALRASAPAFAREIIEQRRAELIADHFWQSQTPALIPGEPVQRSRWANAKRAILGSLAILRSALTGKAHRRNRWLLFSTLRRSASRRELVSSFDRRFYCSANPDVPTLGPLPLLHYLFFGFREGRRPSSDFDSDALLRAFSGTPSSADTNPLLWKCLWGRTTELLEDLD
jgi:glycosyltransferase involved in cell wall biosynthesis